MNSKRHGSEGKDYNLPKGMRIPRVRSFSQRVWQEETIRELRKMKDSQKDKPRIPIEERKIVYSFSHDSWYRIIWRAKVKIELNKFKHKQNLDGSKPVIKILPTSNAWNLLSSIEKPQPESARTP